MSESEFKANENCTLTMTCSFLNVCMYLVDAKRRTRKVKSDNSRQTSADKLAEASSAPQAADEQAKEADKPRRKQRNRRRCRSPNPAV